MSSQELIEPQLQPFQLKHHGESFRHKFGEMLQLSMDVSSGSE